MIKLIVKKMDGEWVVSVNEDGKRTPEVDYHSGGSDSSYKEDAVATAHGMADHYKKHSNQEVIITIR